MHNSALVFLPTALLAGAIRAAPVIDLPLSASGLDRAKVSTELRVTFADSNSVVVGSSRSAQSWTIHDGRLTLALPVTTDSLAPVRRIVGRTGTQRTTGAVCGFALGMAAGYLYADSRRQSHPGERVVRIWWSSNSITRHRGGNRRSNRRVTCGSTLLEIRGHL